MGPLAGFRIVEIGGIGPAPLAAMLLADMGTTVLRLCRSDDHGPGLRKPVALDLVMRNRRSLAIDLKNPAGIDLALELIEKADGLIEGFRPGAAERMGLGPDAALARNPRLVYGRVTGFGQDGPLAQAAGHDINYIALTGALDAIGVAGGKPAIPMNLLGDYAGGSLYLVMGMLAAMLEARQSGKGQVVDAAIVDGTASLMTMIYGLRLADLHARPRGENLLDGGSAIYNVYECLDGAYVSVGPIEPKFRAILFGLIGIDPASGDDPDLQARLEALFRTRTQAEWRTLLEGTDACFAPVLSMADAPHHPHNRARGTFVTIDGVTQPAPAPRFSRTVPALPTPPEAPGAGGEAALLEWGVHPADIEALARKGAITCMKAAAAHV
ncbi:CoA transferase [Sphingobium amiense]|uniref:CoA transferase n=1 Tax=Sphingobium amiense TaxID=135719 RepID=A0A494W509_9SPHN|nr:CaiB/BaiF CoA-transferase family protein [Sphingobium amiense]BBD98406.1 CoA transferase [Sphingobium amiense]